MHKHMIFTRSAVVKALYGDDSPLGGSISASPRKIMFSANFVIKINSFAKKSAACAALFSSFTKKSAE